MSDMLNISEPLRYDEAITRWSYHSYSPFVESYNNSDTIRICIQSQDLVLLPSESFLYVEGSIGDKDGKTVEGYKLNNNCVAFMVDELRYELNSVEIDHSRNLGITTSMKNYLSLKPDESKSLLNAGWNLKENAISDGQFNFCMPLKRLLGFAEDYRKIIPNLRHELILIRAKTNDNAVSTTLTDEYQFNIRKITWKMPHITLNDAQRLKLYQTIQSAIPIKMSFRSWDLYEYPNIPKTTSNLWRVKTANALEKPRYVIFALQTNKLNNRSQNPSEFDHCKLINLKVYLNSEVYPYENLNISYVQNRYALLYHMYARFQETYYGITPMPLLDPNKFKNVAPIVVIDCSQQNEVIKTGPVDVKIEFETAAGGISDNTTAFCLLLHDRIIEYTPLTGDVRKLV